MISYEHMRESLYSLLFPIMIIQHDYMLSFVINGLSSHFINHMKGNIYVQVSTSWPEHNGAHFADGISKLMFLVDKMLFSNQISLIEFASKESVVNGSPSVRVKVWHWPGNHLLPKLMLTMMHLTLVNHGFIYTTHNSIRVFFIL